MHYSHTAAVFGGGVSTTDSPNWYWKLKGTDTATYTLPTKTSTLASIEDIPTKLSQFTDDVVKDNYLSLTGGTISGRLNIGNSTNTSYLPIIFNRNNIQWLLAHNGNNFSIANGDKSLIIGESTGLKYNTNFVFDSNNYTTYINTTNFPGLLSTGTLNSIQIGSNIYSGTNGIVTLPQSLPMAESSYDETDNINVLKHDGSWGIPALAEDLGGREETHHEEFFFQPTAGNDLSIKDGYAKIKSLKGNTIVWNQWVPVSSNLVSPSFTYAIPFQVSIGENYTLFSFTETTTTNTYFCCILANENTYTNHYVSKHKYYVSYTIKNESDIAIGFRTLLNGYADTLISGINQTSFVKYSTIVTDIYGHNSSNVIGRLCFTKQINPNDYIGQNIYIKTASIIDLTQMFGEGNEPTIEEFEAMYPDDYYEYNEGELRSFNGSAIKSVGFNQWDGEVERGYYDVNTGEANNSSNWWRSVNYIRILPNTKYYFKSNVSINSNGYLIYYNNNYEYVTSSHHLNQSITLEFVTPKNAHYLKFYTGSNQSIDIVKQYCLNLSHSGYRDGQYEPYKESRLQLPIKTIKDNNGNLLFPDGLRSAGTAYDEIVYDETLGKYKAIKRIGSVDMGSLNGQYYSVSEGYPYGYFAYYNFNSRKPGKNVLCIKYSTSNKETFQNDKTLVGNTNVNTLYIVDSTYTDFATFKRSLQGQILYYELETPIEVILDDIDLSYEAWDFGTEELLSDVATTPIITETQYNFNAVDMIRNNYFAIKALKEADPLNDLANVAFSGNYNDLENKPDSIKNPNALTITKGSTTTSYDGSEAKTVSIPTKTSELTKDDVYTKTEVYTQSEVNNLINSIEGVVGGIVNTWRPITIQNNSGTNILNLGEGATSVGLTLKAGNNITFTNNNGVVTIGSTYSYTLPAANTALGGIKTGGDLILTNGIATVNGLSTISNNASRGLEAYNWGNHAGKYPTYDGTGASGIWNININGNAATTNQLATKTVFKFGANEATYCKIASLNINKRFEGYSGLLKFYTMRSLYFYDSFEVYVYVYQQDPLGSIPLYSLKSTNSGTAFDIIGVLNYSTSVTTFDIYAYGKNKTYHSLCVSLIYGDFTINPEPYISQLPSGIQIIPTPMGNSEKLNGYLDSDFWKKTELTKLSDLTDDVVRRGYLPLSGGTLGTCLEISSSYDRKIILNNTNNELYYQFISFSQNNKEYGYLGTAGNANLVWTGAIILHADNYTSYINETEFPGLNKTGTVTSVALTVPTGLSVSGSPITSRGTLAISLASGYSIPTTTKQTNWDTAYGWGNHANAGYLTAINANMITSALGYTPIKTDTNTWRPVKVNDVLVLSNSTSTKALDIRQGGNITITENNGVITISSSDTYTGTVTSVKVGSTSYTPTSGIVSLPAYPTTLPASDVYAWAKASTKPSYSWNEITNKPIIPIVGNAAITIKQNGTIIGAFNANQLNDITITLPDTHTYSLGMPGNPGLAEPAGATSDTGFILNSHAQSYHAVQVNGEGKLVVNVPRTIKAVAFEPSTKISIDLEEITHTVIPEGDCILSFTNEGVVHIYHRGGGTLTIGKIAYVDKEAASYNIYVLNGEIIVEQL